MNCPNCRKPAETIDVEGRKIVNCQACDQSFEIRGGEAVVISDQELGYLTVGGPPPEPAGPIPPPPEPTGQRKSEGLSINLIFEGD